MDAPQGRAWAACHLARPANLRLAAAGLQRRDTRNEHLAGRDIGLRPAEGMRTSARVTPSQRSSLIIVARHCAIRLPSAGIRSGISHPVRIQRHIDRHPIRLAF
ncbi:hypothetical protein PDE01_28900 [Paracoccus denitrificans]|jgi:hypothetical protein|nr:hypothetical protein PDE01_28900 [Paracoccus denitrificans]